MNKTIKVLIVVSGNSEFRTPFILDQINHLENNGIEIEYFLIKGKGLMGYLKNYGALVKKIKLYRPDIVHAHYGLSGLFAVMQRGTPVVITFHGSDVNDPKERKLSRIAHMLSDKSIFVSEPLAKILNVKKPIVIPCGVDMDIFYPRDKNSMRLKFGLSEKKKYALFSSSFNNDVKNYPLAKEAVNLVENLDVELLELKGYTREDVALLMNAVDVALMTSFTEGSPQFIKEALATNTPIVSTDVGDVKNLIMKTEGCYISKSNSQDVSDNIKRAIEFNKKTKGRKTVEHLNNRMIAVQIIEIYESIIKTR